MDYEHSLTLLLCCPCLCCHSFFMIVCGLFEWKRICVGCFIVCLYMYCRWRSSYQEGRVGIPLVQDSSAVRRLFGRLAGAVGRQIALHKENSGFAAPTLGWHISMFRGYRILFSIRNPYINRFTNHFSIHS